MHYLKLNLGNSLKLLNILIKDRDIHIKDNNYINSNLRNIVNIAVLILKYIPKNIIHFSLKKK